jgi:hypothetical protein
MEKSIWQLGIGAWLLSLVTVSVFLTVMLAAGLLFVQNRVEDRMVIGRGEQRDIPVTTLEQRIAKLQAANHFGDHACAAAGATMCETWIAKTQSRGQWR